MWCWHPSHWEVGSMSSSLDPGWTFVTSSSISIKWKWSYVPAEARSEKCHAFLPWPWGRWLLGTSYHAEWEPSNHVERWHVGLLPTASTRILADGQEQVPGEGVSFWWFQPPAIKYISHSTFEPAQLMPQKLEMSFLHWDLSKLKTGEWNDDCFFRLLRYAIACYAVKDSWSIWTQFMYLD